MKKVLDKKGNEIREFDVLKVFHFIGAVRRKKHYMYKWVQIKNGELCGLHLHDNSGESFPLWVCADKDTHVFTDAEIVQTKYN